MNYCNCPNCATTNCPAAVENAALREHLEVCKSALRELDLTGIQYQEKPVDAVGRMRGIAVAALNRLT